MIGIGGLFFTTPWILGSLLFLPVLWWLLRVTPPAPRKIRFPALFLLRDLLHREETPARTPWWLLLLRMVMAALIILALAGPILNPAQDLGGRGPILIVVDNDWAAAHNWQERREMMQTIADRAARQGRMLYLLPTARSESGAELAVSDALRPSELRRLAAGLSPVSWPRDEAGMQAALRAFYDDHQREAHVIWLANGLATRQDAEIFRAMQRFGQASIILDSEYFPELILPPMLEKDVLRVPVHRAYRAAPATMNLRAIGADGRLISSAELRFDPGQEQGVAEIRVPAEIRHEITRLELADESSAGGVYLLDERWKERPVGIVTPGAAAQPLLDAGFYLTRALESQTQVQRGEILDLIESGVAMIVLADRGRLSLQEREALLDWVQNGGVLVHFAGANLAEAGGEPELLPVTLRRGERSLGGALSWSEPQGLAPMPESGPLAGLAVPSDILIRRQVLAQPGIELQNRVWARLQDDTPLVTGRQEERGWLVLVHTSADPAWSDLALSGLYVRMLSRFLDLSGGMASGTGGRAESRLPPLYSLMGDGRLAAPPAAALPVSALDFAETEISAINPPGYYGFEQARRALNLGDRLTPPQPLRNLPRGVNPGSYRGDVEISLKGHFITAALILLLLDMLISLLMRGLIGLDRLRGWLRPVSATAIVAGIVAGALLFAAPVRADYDEAEIIRLTGGNYIAYIQSGDAVRDRVTRLGLEGLIRILEERTSIAITGVEAVDPEQHELSFFPMIYWSMAPDQRRLSDTAIRRLNSFMHHGGVLVIDTHDQLYGASAMGQQASGQHLQELAGRLDIPPLEPVPQDHVMTRAFYLLNAFPGRYAGGTLWVEAGDDRLTNDGVTPILVTSNDFVGAWAMDETRRPLLATSPGGERQREMAYRVGVNLMMYVYTGNYKQDQVHAPAILERLGQ